MPFSCQRRLAAGCATAIPQELYPSFATANYELGSSNGLLGGGRYDRLFRSLDAEVTASGFCVSLDRLVGRFSAAEDTP